MELLTKFKIIQIPDKKCICISLVDFLKKYNKLSLKDKDKIKIDYINYDILLLYPKLSENFHEIIFDSSYYLNFKSLPDCFTEFKLLFLEKNWNFIVTLIE